MFTQPYKRFYFWLQNQINWKMIFITIWPFVNKTETVCCTSTLISQLIPHLMMINKCRLKINVSNDKLWLTLGYAFFFRVFFRQKLSGWDSKRTKNCIFFEISVLASIYIFLKTFFREWKSSSIVLHPILSWSVNGGWVYWNSFTKVAQKLAQ